MTQELTGSEKQIAWATQIRDEVMAGLEAARADFAANGNTEWLPTIERAIAILNAQTNAGYWIDLRDSFRRFHTPHPAGGYLTYEAFDRAEALVFAYDARRRSGSRHIIYV